MQNKNAAVILGIVTLKANSSHSHFFFYRNWLYFSYSIFLFF